MSNKNKELGKMLSQDEMKKVLGGQLILKDLGCVVQCCYGWSPTNGCWGHAPIAIETCNNIPWGCYLPESPCSCYAS